MIPIDVSQLVNFDINKEETWYKNILNSQFIFCNTSKNKRIIKQYAEDTYNKVVVEKSKFHRKGCCNFKLLEEKCIEYKKIRVLIRLMKLYLEDQGVIDEALAPRSTIRAACKYKIIIDGDTWIKMMLDRNMTSHMYDESIAYEIVKRIKEVYIYEFIKLKIFLQDL